MNNKINKIIIFTFCFVISLMCFRQISYAQESEQKGNVECYVAVDDDKYFVWLNDKVNNEEISDALVTIENVGSSKIDKDGVAIIERNDADREEYFTIKVEKDNKVIYFDDDLYYADLTEACKAYGYDKLEQDFDYYSFIFTDKGIYTSNDSINIWGLVKPRVEDKKTGNLVIELCTRDSNTREYTSLISKEISLNEFNTFTSQLTLNNLSIGEYYYLVIKNDNSIIQTKKIIISNINFLDGLADDFSSDKKVAFIDEDINIDLNAHNFGKDAIKNGSYIYKFSCDDEDDDIIKGNGRTDDNGNSQISINSFKDYDTWHSKRYRINIDFLNNLGSMQDMDYYIFPRDVMLNVDYDQHKDASVQVNIETNKIVLDNVRNETNFTREDIKGQAVDIPLEVKLYEKNDSDMKLIDTKQLNTCDGEVSFNFMPSDECKYLIEVTCKDLKERNIVQEFETQKFHIDTIPIDNDLDVVYYLKTNDGKDKYKIGDTVCFDLTNNQPTEVSVNKKGRVLYLFFADGLIDYKVSDKLTCDYKLTNKNAHDVILKAIYFDGNKSYMTDENTISVDYVPQTLNVDIKSDKEIYKPGEIVKLDVDIYDIDKNSVQGEFYFDMIDDNYYSIIDEYVIQTDFIQHPFSTLDNIYAQNITDGLISESLSGKTNYLYVGARNRGIGHNALLAIKEFTYNSIHKVIKTDKDGKAHIEFKLPENKTNWRINYQVLTKDLQASSGKFIINTYKN